MEANLYRAVRAMVPSVKAVRVPAPFTCYVSIEQRLIGQAKNAILSVLGADLYMKRVVVVDEDVNIFDDRQVTWAIATRCQPDRDITIITNARGSDLDPSSREDGYSAKWGVDATAKPSLAGYTPRHRVPPEVWKRLEPEGLRGVGRRATQVISERTPNVAARLAAAARRRPEHPALIWEGGALSWRELEARAAGMARRLAPRGRGRGRRRRAAPRPTRGAWSPRSGAASRSGPRWRRSTRYWWRGERERILGHLRPKAVVDTAPAEDGAEAMTIADPAAPGIILYTSGSTGQPKGTLLSHAALAIANDSWAGPVMALAPDDRVLAALPLAHSFGLNGALLAPLLAGVTVVLQERFSPEETLRAIGRHRVTVFPGVATMFARILESPALTGADVSSLRLAVSGAAPCPWPLASEWRRRTGVRIVRGYGMTELFRPISYLAAEPTDLPDSIGRAVPGVELRLRWRGDELWIRSPAAMDGYLRAPEETAAVLEDGWFKTGDLATISPDGFVSIVGRKRELILRGGYSVVPGEVEATLLGHPAVAEAAVVGVAARRARRGGGRLRDVAGARRGRSGGADRVLSRAAGRLQVSAADHDRGRAAEERDGEDPEGEAAGVRPLT